MPRTVIPDAVVVSPVEYVAGVWHFRREPAMTSHAFSTPGHLFHYMMRGHYQLITNGRSYHVREGDVIYYHGTETVTCHWGDEVVEIISVAFHAPQLAPLPLDRRVFRARKKDARLFEKIHDAYYAPSGDSARLHLFALLHELLLCLGMRPDTLRDEVTCGALHGDGVLLRDARKTWNEMEVVLRRERRFHVTIDELCSMGHCSRATLNRICRRATGMSPQERLRSIRMDEARGLLLYSPLSLSEIAKELGFGRQHELTREFSRHFSHPPSTLRSKA